MKVWRVVIAGVGGQGSGVISELLFHAARAERRERIEGGSVPAAIGERLDLERRTMLPGLAQRSGATITSVAFVAPDADALPPRVSLGEGPFEQCADLLVGQEMAETLRQAGFLRADGAVVTSERRAYSAVEKTPDGGEPAAPSAIRRALDVLSPRVVALDTDAILERAGLPQTHSNLVLLGAVAASRFLPIGLSAYRAAVTLRFGAAEAGRAAHAAFEAGRAAAGESSSAAPAFPLEERPFPELIEARAAELRVWRGATAEREFRVLAARAAAAFPPPVRNLVAEGMAQLLDFQGAAYARRYVEWVAQILAVDGDPGFRLTRLYARHLAGRILIWEDPIRVAQMKVRHTRLPAGVVVRQVAKLRPPIEEVLLALPARFATRLLAVRRIRRWFERRRYDGLRMGIPVTSLWGMALFRLLAALRPFRAYSTGYVRTIRFAARHHRRVLWFAAVDYDLGCEIAAYAARLRGYTDTRERNRRAYELLSRMASAVLRGGGENAASAATGHFRRGAAFVAKDGVGVEKLDRYVAKVLAGLRAAPSAASAADAEVSAATLRAADPH